VELSNRIKESPMSIKPTWIVATLFSLFLLPAISVSQIYELRTYTTHEGKLENLLDRFQHHTTGLFEKHGIRNVGYWLPTEKPNTLIYIVAHNDRSGAKNAWKSFSQDPDWKKARAASIADGPIITNIESTYMNKTPFSP
jgi:hypothetical protein|tara:strand:- start:68 stop:487 length:420 start_codon:yes stop_codon:yes gene_type:complete